MGFGCGWAKLNVVQFGSACAVACTSFNFAKRWHFLCRFSFRLLSVVSSFRVAGNGLPLKPVRGIKGRMFELRIKS